MSQVVTLDAGSGGSASQRLVDEIFFKNFKNEILATLDDAALLKLPGASLAMSTDTYTVTPLFFPGGSIGDLAINGTVNDVSMLGAVPLWLTCAFILEEGLPMEILEKVARDMAKACAKANVSIVSGDTKVVPRGACDKMFITTTGLGQIFMADPPSGHKAKAGDSILLSGAVGDHGLAIMGAREHAFFLDEISSDSAPLAEMVKNIVDSAGEAHVLRDPTRGGLATTLNEIAMQSSVGIEVDEESIPVHRAVEDGCSFLGLDPLYLANEGKCVCILPKEKAELALQAMRQSPYGQEAAIIGTVKDGHPGRVVLNTSIGGQRILGMLEGSQLPRIC